MNLDAYLSGSTEPWAVSVLQALVRLKKPRRILELGTFEGRTTRALVDVAKGVEEFVTVDIEDRWEDRPMNTQTYSFIQDDAIEFLKRLEFGVFDFVFVDDDHTRAHVEEELDLLMGGVVSPGGVIVLHDVIGPFDLGSLVTSRGGFIIELPLLHAAGGLGVIEVPE